MPQHSNDHWKTNLAKVITAQFSPVYPRSLHCTVSPPHEITRPGATFALSHSCIVDVGSVVRAKTACMLEPNCCFCDRSIRSDGLMDHPMHLLLWKSRWDQGQCKEGKLCVLHEFELMLTYKFKVEHLPKGIKSDPYLLPQNFQTLTPLHLNRPTL